MHRCWSHGHYFRSEVQEVFGLLQYHKHYLIDLFFDVKPVMSSRDHAVIMTELHCSVTGLSFSFKLFLYHGLEPHLLKLPLFSYFVSDALIGFDCSRHCFNKIFNCLFVV